MSEGVWGASVALVGPVFPFRGGIAHYTTSLAQTLQKQGHQLLLVSFKRQYPSWLYPGVTDKDPSERGFEAGEPKFWIDSLNPLTWLMTFWRIRTFTPEVIVLQWWTTFFAPIWLVFVLLNKVWLNAPIVFICHNVLPHEERRFDRWIVWLVLSQSAHIVVQSDVEHERVSMLLPDAVVSVVPHPVYDIFASGSVDPHKARTSLKLEKDQFVLLFFGMVRAYKGVRELLFALPHVVATYPNTRLLIAGEFWEDKREYFGLIQTLGLEDVVQIEDRYIPNEDVASYYSAADLLVAPYRRQTGSGVIQVAAALNLPVVTLNGLSQQSALPESLLFEQRVDYLSKTLVSSIQRAQNCKSVIDSSLSTSESTTSKRITPKKPDSTEPLHRHSGQTTGSTWADLANKIMEIAHEH